MNNLQKYAILASFAFSSVACNPIEFIQAAINASKQSKRDNEIKDAEHNKKLDEINNQVTPINASAYSMYIIQKGDTVSAIAGRCKGVAHVERRITDGNYFDDPNNLKVGQKLWVPPRCCKYIKCVKTGY